MEKSIAPSVLKHFNQLKSNTIQEDGKLNPLSNELDIINKAYADLKVLPCERLVNHYDHFKFETEKELMPVYLTTRDILYADYWKFILTKKLNAEQKSIVKANRRQGKKTYYPTSFIENIEILDGDKLLKITPEDYLLKSEYNGYCRTDFRNRVYD